MYESKQESVDSGELGWTSEKGVGMQLDGGG